MKVELADFFAKGGLIDKHLKKYELRAGQANMSAAILDAILNNDQLIVEAQTGIGKSFAYLIPAILSGKRVAISTCTKNLQEQLVERDIPFVEQLFNDKIKVAILKGRGNYLCRRRYESYATENRSLYRSFEADLLSKFAATTTVGDKNEIRELRDDSPAWSEVNSRRELCLGKNCTFYDSCFYFKMRKSARLADLVVVNHHLFFSDFVAQSNTNSEISIDYDVLIFDEAHQIESIATEYYGDSFNDQQLMILLRSTTKELGLASSLTPEAETLLKKVEEELLSMFALVKANMPAGGNFELREVITGRLQDILREPVKKSITLLREVGDFLEGLRSIKDPSVTLAEQFHNLATVMESFVLFDRDDYIYWTITHANRVELRATPINISNRLKDELYPNLKSVIFTSATLAVDGDFSFIKASLGLEESKELQIGSPFDYKSQALIYLSPNLPLPTSKSYHDELAKEIRRLIRLTSGRAFVLFTNKVTLNSVYEKLQDDDRFNWLAQGKAPRTTLLDRFVTEPHSVLLGLASFWQGVDIKGSALVSVIIEKLPFAYIKDPLIEAKMALLKKANKDPFREFQLPMAVLLLKQGVGRLIRSQDDYGLIALLDSRVLTRSYGKTIINALPDCAIEKNFDKLKVGLTKMLSNKEPVCK
ncbi:MAG: ATP-dependent DNA helicase [Nitrospinota bacterium]